MKRWLARAPAVASLGAAIAMFGCSHAPDHVTAESTRATRQATPSAADPRRALYDQLHASAYQVSEALDHLNDCVSALRPVASAEKGDTKQVLGAIVDVLDHAGRAIADDSDSPDLGEVRKDPSAAEIARGARIDRLNEATSQILEAESSVDDLVGSGPPAKILNILKGANDAADDAVDALSEAVRQLGGKPIDDSAKGDAPADSQPAT